MNTNSLLDSILSNSAETAQSTGTTSSSPPSPSPDIVGYDNGKLAGAPRLTLDVLQETLSQQEQRRRDHIVSISDLRMSENGRLTVAGQWLDLNTYSRSQLGTLIGVPGQYLNKLSGNAMDDLQRDNVNRWLRRLDPNKQIQLRIEDQTIRAILSERYAKFDDVELVETLRRHLPGDTPVRYEQSDRTSMLQLIEGETGDDGLQSGITVRNSEVGAASIALAALIYRTICTNGLIMGYDRSGMNNAKRRHVGSHGNLRSEMNMLAQQAASQASQDRKDFDKTKFTVVPEHQRDGVYTRIQSRYSLTEGQVNAAKSAFEVEPGETLYHVINSVTRAGNDTSLNLEQRTRMQEVGGNMLVAVKTGRSWVGGES
ncbi:DUF932 domain-containing protein [Planctomycetota bacterium]|nr:DUF932 domain-containing protein [Planctomycetota bacterium]